MSRSKRLQTGQLRARFAAGLSAMYAAEVPAYGTLVEVCAQVNSDYLTRHRRAERLGSLQRVTAERHGAIQWATRPNSLRSPTCSPRSGCCRSATTICAPLSHQFQWCPPHFAQSMRTSWHTTRFGCSPRCWPSRIGGTSMPTYAPECRPSSRAGNSLTRVARPGAGNRG